MKLQRLDRVIGYVAEIIAATVLALGTLAQFGLPYWEYGLHSVTGCYRTDALVVYVMCDPASPLDAIEGLLTYSYYLTWGIFWPLAFLPVLWFVVIPALAVWSAVLVLAARSLVRRIRRQGAAVR